MTPILIDHFAHIRLVNYKTRTYLPNLSLYLIFLAKVLFEKPTKKYL